MTQDIENKTIRRLDVLNGELCDPKWSDIEAAIRQLDGLTHTIVILGIGDPIPHMAIGGGKRDHYVLYATFDNVVFYTLADPTMGPGLMQLVVGSQGGNYERRNCVTLDLALKAAKTYAETGQLDSQLTWDSK